jgi:hypothetical protein
VNKKRPPLAWAALGLLGALVATNVTFLILMRTSGPLVGAVFYLALLVVVWRRRQPDYRPVIVGGLVGLVVHIVEVILLSWTAYPLLMALNLILPAVLVPAAWLAGREM